MSIIVEYDTVVNSEANDDNEISADIDENEIECSWRKVRVSHI